MNTLPRYRRRFKRPWALPAALTLLCAALVTPMIVLGGVGTATCPTGTSFLDNIEVQNGNITDTFDGLTFTLINGGTGLQVTNTTADQTFVIVVKGGSSNNGGGDGTPITVGPGQTVIVTAPTNPNNGNPFGVSNFSICGSVPGSPPPT
jgi:hypothetical protein